MKAKVYRVRNIPGQADSEAARALIADSLDGLAVDHVLLWSLASATIAIPGENLPRKIATVTFKKTPTIFDEQTGKSEWRLSSIYPLVLDSHFHGITPLNDVDPIDHEYDCVAISGLSSHPFGSWQPRGGDKSFMWIRDILPKRLLSVRFFLYGYDTNVVKSSSKQTIADLSTSLVNTLEANGWSSPSGKPLVFIAHSLGGVILKQALVLLANGGVREVFLLNQIKGCVFFGVPSRGMPLDNVLGLMRNKPNEGLVHALSDRSDYVASIDQQFRGITHYSRLRLIWAFETKLTPTVLVGSWTQTISKSGPGVIMVPKDSATHFANPIFTVQIDEDHSSMVKFSDDDNNLNIIIKKLSDICLSDDHGAVLSRTGQSFRESVPLQKSLSKIFEAFENEEWERDVMLNSLRTLERDDRMEQIDPRFEHTLEWVFERHLGFTDWLESSGDIFWINGKPGCGKSTLMKFIYQDPRTHELLGMRSPRSRQITAAFFFHHRGKVMQKSVEGLLRSILSQVLEARPELLDKIRPILIQKYRERAQRRCLSDVASDICNLYTELGVPSKEVGNAMEQTLPTRKNALETMRRVFLPFNKSKTDEYVQRIEDVLMSARSDLVKHKLTKKFAALASAVAARLGVGEAIKRRYQHKSGRPEEEDASEKSDDNNEAAMFLTLVQEWIESLSLRSRICQALARQGISTRQEVVGRRIDEILRSEAAREEIREQVRLQGWTRETLENALTNVSDQQLVDLDICLFLDAIDEYDGWPESIALFMKKLVRNSATSKTSIKICFSSRPWTTFLDHFKSYPSFQVHENTEDDIRNYCRGIISSGPRHARPLLFDMIPSITNRAKGVFLWVQLVLRDLSSVANENPLCSQNNLNKLLRTALDSLPDQLDEYYVTIIERLPAASRWDSYVVLDSMARRRSAMTLWAILEVLECSTASTISEGEARVEKLKKKSQYWAEERLRTLSGGLVEIADSADRSNGPPLHRNLQFDPEIQLMHQTVQEFVEDTTFKLIILGERANTPGNGHTFLSSYYLTVDRWEEAELAWNARESEVTTGRSQYGLFSTIDGTPLALQDLNVQSAIEYAAQIGLDLYIRDALHDDNAATVRECQKNALKGILLSTLSSIESDIHPERITRAKETAMVISENGLSVDKEDLVPFVDSACAVTATSSEMVEFWLSKREACSTLAIVLLDKMPHSSSKWLLDADENGISYLHSAPQTLAGWILRCHHNDADPSVLASDGKTPLDCQVQGNIDLKDFSPRRLLPMLYGSSCELVKHGGVLNKTKRTEWDVFIATLRERGFDLDVFDGCNMPRWLGEEPSRPPDKIKVRVSWRKKLGVVIFRKRHREKGKMPE